MRFSFPCRQILSRGTRDDRLKRMELFNKFPLPKDLMPGVLEGDKEGEKFQFDDVPSGAHIALEKERWMLRYMRLIEHEMPKLVAYRKPFVPPTAESPLVIRSVDYAGEEHPLTAKRTVVVPVAQLPLQSDKATHTLKLLAGPRWTPDAPKNAGVPLDDEQGKHGYIKISCEDFGRPAMNLKWISDTIDDLVKMANGKEGGSFQSLPLDTRHLDAKIKKAKKGDHTRGRTSRPSLKDFPKEWLSQLPLPPTNTVPSPTH